MGSGADPQTRAQGIRKVLWGILVANWVVAAAKLSLGLLSDSAALTADGVHSFIDGSSNVIGLLAMAVAARPADLDHPYGHGKFEALAALGIGALIGASLVELGRMAVGSLLYGRHPQVTGVMVAVMAATLLTNVVVTRVERRFGKKLGSPLLLADAQHTFSDVLVSAAVIVSLVLVKLGFEKADGVVALGVMVVVGAVAFGIVRQAVGSLADAARLDALQVERTGLAIDGVKVVRQVRSRGLEEAVFVDLIIQVENDTSVEKAHTLAHSVEKAITQAFPQVVDVVVHVEPLT